MVASWILITLIGASSGDGYRLEPIYFNTLESCQAAAKWVKAKEPISNAIFYSWKVECFKVGGE